jgi:signal transduction histidine kinase
MPKIYDPFFTTKRGSGGTGLGLNIVFNIVTDTLRGRIECQSSVGVGTCFTVRMPRYTTR